LNHSQLRHILADIFKPYFVTDQIEIAMFAHFPLHATTSMESKGSTDWLSRLGDWWPAALIGLLALLSGAPDSNAQTLLDLLR
jgi:hypothetical protein